MNDQITAMLVEYRQASAIREKESHPLTGRIGAHNDAMDRMREIAHVVLKQDRATSEHFFTDLVCEGSDTLSLSAATHLLHLNEQKALTQLERIAAKDTILGFEARIVVQEWRKGALSRT